MSDQVTTCTDSPRHHLEQWPELRMGLIQIDAGSHDLPELRVRIAAFRAACLVRRQIAAEAHRLLEGRKTVGKVLLRPGM